MFTRQIFILVLQVGAVWPREVNFEAEGAVPDDQANEIAWLNGNLLNRTLGSLAPGTELDLRPHFI